MGLLVSLPSTYIFLALLGPMPFMELIALLSGTMRYISGLAVILLIMGLYGLSVRYKAPILILVAVLDGVVLILNEVVRVYFAAIGDIAGGMTVGLGTFIVESLASMIFGITLLSLRDHSKQPPVFTICGLVEVTSHVVYFLMAIMYVSLAYVVSHSTATVVRVFLVALYHDEIQRGPILAHQEISDWSQPSEVWE